MDVSTAAITYAMLIIPAFFALTVLFQGFTKLSRSEPDGQAAIGFGVFLLVLIVTAYFLYIR